MRKLTPTLLAIALVAGACSNGTSSLGAPEEPRPAPGGDPTVGLDNDDIRLLAGLVPFNGCGDLLDHLQAEARERVGPYGLDYNGFGYYFGEEGRDVTATADAPAAEEAVASFDTSGDDGGGDRASSGATAPAVESDSARSGDGVSTTNVQEVGVDEPDLIKTDGDRMLVVSENVLSYIDISSGKPEKTDSITLPADWNHELFFQGDRVLVFANSNNWGGGPVIAETLSDDAEASFAEEPAADADFVEERRPELVEPEWYGPASTILEIDISDPGDLQIVATMRIQGQYLSARRVGDTVRLALTSPPAQLEWLYPSSPAGEDRAERANRELIDETTVEDWVPEYELTTADGSERGALLDCDSLHHPADFSGFDVVSVLSFDLDNGLDKGQGAGVLASGQTVYASTDRFYIATTQWAGEEIVDGDFVEWNETYTTDIHAFSISPDEPAAYVASGMVSGSLLNQFSMDEHDGYLRIITTDGSPWDERNLSETSLVVLDESGEVLTQVGSVGGIGKGESLYSARLLDDVGFAVTFRQIDPFYVLDLTDPTNPRVTGELKIPGFSTYLHPIDANYVLGIGQDATEQGGTLGLKVSLFSVADPANPKEIDSWTMRNANSPAEWDHRAFQFLAEEGTGAEGIAIVPFTTHSGDSDGAVLLKIDDETISEVGRVTHQSPADQPTTDCDVIDGSDFPEDTELFWMTQEGAHLQLCDSNNNGGYGGWYCDVIPVEDLRYWGPEEQMTELIEDLVGGEPSPEDRLEMCWPDGGNYRLQIQRSFVIDGTIWTMSPSQVQANDFNDLSVIGAVGI
jgi:uncharacterized secreted protein with C-terminal beta-propeller domain